MYVEMLKGKQKALALEFLYLDKLFMKIETDRGSVQLSWRYQMFLEKIQSITRSAPLVAPRVVDILDRNKMNIVESGINLPHHEGTLICCVQTQMFNPSASSFPEDQKNSSSTCFIETLSTFPQCNCLHLFKIFIQRCGCMHCTTKCS